MSKGWIKRLAVTGAVAAVVSIGLAGVAVISAPQETAQADRNSRALPVTTLEAESVPGYAVHRAFLGRVEARRESPVGFELGGLISEISADDGDHLEAGQVLARLDTNRLEMLRRQLLGRRAELEASIGLAKVTRARQEKLAEKGHASQQRFDEARFDEKALAGRLQQVDAEIAAVELDIEKSEIRAPYPAIVAARLADEGTVIGAGTPLFELLERADPEVRIGVAGPAIDRIAVGQSYDLLVRGRRIPATVVSVLPVRDRDTRSVDVLLRLHAPLNGIRRGDLARLEIARQVARPGFWLPLSALTESARGLWAVYVAVGGTKGDADAPAVLERRELEVLHQESERVFVRGTLAEGEQVVVGGLHRLVPGQEVHAIPAPEHRGDLLAAVKEETGQ